MKSFYLTLATLCLIGCSAVAPTGEQFRLRNLHDERLNEQLTVYQSCYAGRDAPYLVSREYPAGKQQLLIRAMKQYKLEPRLAHHEIHTAPEIYFVLPGNFKAGHIYAIKAEDQGNNLSVWVEDVASGEIVTEKVAQELKLPELGKTRPALNRRCAELGL